MRRFVTLDVFTRTRFAGNPLAVVLDAEGLDKPAMQTIAREFNLPETVFVFAPANAVHAAKLRIFTPANELPFAGHPTVGAAVWLGRAASGKTRDIVLEEEIGLVPCSVTTHDTHGRARFDLPRLPERTADAPAADKIALALGLQPQDIGCGDFLPARWSAGVEFTFVPVRDLRAIGRAKPNGEYFDSILGHNGPGRAFLFCEETAEKGHHYHARMFAPAMGIPEDPATGSGAAAFAGIVAHGLGEGAHNLQLEQGYEMGRPSLIELSLTIAQSKLKSGSIGGDAVLVGEGAIEA